MEKDWNGSTSSIWKQLYISEHNSWFLANRRSTVDFVNNIYRRFTNWNCLIVSFLMFSWFNLSFSVLLNKLCIEEPRKRDWIINSNSPRWRIPYLTLRWIIAIVCTKRAKSLINGITHAKRPLRRGGEWQLANATLSLSIQSAAHEKHDSLVSYTYHRSITDCFSLF